MGGPTDTKEKNRAHVRPLKEARGMMLEEPDGFVLMSLLVPQAVCASVLFPSLPSFNSVTQLCENAYNRTSAPLSQVLFPILEFPRVSHNLKILDGHSISKQPTHFKNKYL